MIYITNIATQEILSLCGVNEGMSHMWVMTTSADAAQKYCHLLVLKLFKDVVGCLLFNAELKTMRIIAVADAEADFCGIHSTHINDISNGIIT